MKHQTLQGTGKIVCSLELALLDTKDQLELQQQKVKELQSFLRDKENEISFLKEVLSAKADIIRRQQNSITSLHKKLGELNKKPDPPVIVMKTYLPEIAEEEISETAV